MTYIKYREGNFWGVEIYYNSVLIYRVMFDHDPSDTEIQNVIASLQGVGPPPDIDTGQPSLHNLLNGDVHPDTDEISPQEGMLIVGKNYNGIVKWSGLPIGTSGKILVSDGTKPVWDNLPTHASSHTSNGNDPITGTLDANARVAVAVNSNLTGTRRRINFIPGTGINISATDNPTNEEVQVTIASSGGSGLNYSNYYILNPIVANTYYIPYAVAGVALTTLTLTGGNVYYIPFILRRSYIVTALGINVTTARAGTAYIGIYTHNPTTHRPNSLIYASSALDTGTTGAKTVTGLNIQLSAGEVYWVALYNSGGPTVRAVAVGSMQVIMGVAITATAWTTMYTQSGATGLPSTPNPTAGATSAVPAIFFQFSLP